MFKDIITFKTAADRNIFLKLFFQNLLSWYVRSGAAYRLEMRQISTKTTDEFKGLISRCTPRYEIKTIANIYTFPYPSK